MKKCIAALVAALTLFIVAQVPAFPESKQEKAYIAVYSDPVFVKYWDVLKVDYVQSANTWDDFPGFIRHVKEESKGRPIIIDLNVHGTRGGFLSIHHIDKCTHGRANKSYMATVGYVLKEISTLGEENIRALVLESCYGGHVYFKSREGFNPSYRGGNRLDSYTGVAPYPIYGVDNCVSWNNVVFIQLANGDNVNIHDLREYSKSPPPGELGGGSSDKSQTLYWYVQYNKQRVVLKYLKNLIDLTTK